MKRTQLTIVVMLAVLAGACGPKKPQTTPVRPTMETEAGTIEKSDKMSFEEAVIFLRRVPENETEQAKRKRELALSKAECELKADLERRTSVTDIRVEREATKEIRKADKAKANQENDLVRARSAAHIQVCDPETVYVNPKAEEVDRASFLGKIYIVGTVDFHNNGSGVVRITTSSRNIGLVVDNLCPGGSLILSFLKTPFDGSQSEEIQLTATSVLPNSQAVTETSSVRLDVSYSRYQRTQNQPWIFQRR